MTSPSNRVLDFRLDVFNWSRPLVAWVRGRELSGIRHDLPQGPRLSCCGNRCGNL
jgi:hypothetical protein